MDPAVRPLFNAHDTQALHARVEREMGQRLHSTFDFRLAETPVFLPQDLRDRCVRVAEEIVRILRDPALIERCEHAVPPEYLAPRMDRLPNFVAVDLAIVRDSEGRLAPRVIELQGFASLYAMQVVFAEVWRDALQEAPGLDRDWIPFFSGLDRERYLDLLRRAIVGPHDPENVVLLDLHPERQKTRPDFVATRQFLGVHTAGAHELVRRGDQLLVPRNGGLVPVRRVYHRVVFDELREHGFDLPFDYRDDLDVEWVAHPNWYWIWSKYTLPLIEHPALPWTAVLSDVLSGGRLPGDPSRYILKPLFSYAGRGVRIDFSQADLDSIPEHERADWIVQEKVEYAPAVVDPEGNGVKVEIRMMFIRPHATEELTLAMNLVRLSRGKMHGVDHNKDMTWVGSSVALWEA
ncbi:MAG: hypothetical protein H0V09_10685 [Gemmatimonadetes bacterium]|nr:hypothetical protein [Gemmatimonadota bacterium]